MFVVLGILRHFDGYGEMLCYLLLWLNWFNVAIGVYPESCIYGSYETVESIIRSGFGIYYIAMMVNKIVDFIRFCVFEYGYLVFILGIYLVCDIMTFLQDFPIVIFWYKLHYLCCKKTLTILWS